MAANNNPYSYDPDVDADLFETGEQQEQTDGVCPGCGKSHPSFDDLPPPMAEALHELIATAGRGFDTEPAEEVKLIHGFFNSVARLDRTDLHGPILAAQLVAAETGDPRVRALIDLFSIERALVASHLALKRANDYLVGLRNEPEPDEDVRIRERLLAFGCEFLLARVAALGDDYAAAADRLDGAYADPQVVTTGTYTDPDPLRVRVLVAPLRTELP